MAIHNFAAIDLGASSGRVILATTSEGKINLEEIHRFSDPIIEMQGHFYWDFPAIYKSVIEGLARWFEYDWCLRRQDDNKINNKINKDIDLCINSILASILFISSIFFFFFVL